MQKHWIAAVTWDSHTRLDSLSPECQNIGFIWAVVPVWRMQLTRLEGSWDGLESVWRWSSMLIMFVVDKPWRGMRFVKAGISWSLVCLDCVITSYECMVIARFSYVMAVWKLDAICLLFPGFMFSLISRMAFAFWICSLIRRYLLLICHFIEFLFFLNNCVELIMKHYLNSFSCR